MCEQEKRKSLKKDCRLGIREKEKVLQSLYLQMGNIFFVPVPLCELVYDVEIHQRLVTIHTGRKMREYAVTFILISMIGKNECDICTW